jgi:hypothetical protein
MRCFNFNANISREFGWTPPLQNSFCESPFLLQTGGVFFGRSVFAAISYICVEGAILIRFCCCREAREEHRVERHISSGRI